MLLVCVVSFFVLVWHSRSFGVSLGLPVAYLFSTLFQYLPGAFGHLVRGNFFDDSNTTQLGLRLTTIGVVSFVAGVVLAQRIMRGAVDRSDTRWLHQVGTMRFAEYCLWGGWLLLFVGIPLGRIPSVGAAINRGGLIWVLGVLIGLLVSIRQGRSGKIFLWLAALSVYPLAGLIFGGFLSLGSTSVFVVFSAWLMILKSHIRAYTVVVVFFLVCLLGFLSYYKHREEIRSDVWEGGTLEKRAVSSIKIVTDIAWFDPNNPEQLTALDDRLNQCKFVGMAAWNIASGEHVFLHGRSVWEGLQALVPRMLWPDKPVFSGGSKLFTELTGFMTSEYTSYGVGQVMELYVSYGVPSLVVGFLLFGFAYGWIDRNTAAALSRGEFGLALMWFLPGVAINAPLASIAEETGNMAAAVVAAYGWRYAWGAYYANTPTKRRGKQLAGITKQTDGVVPAESKQESGKRARLGRNFLRHG